MTRHSPSPARSCVAAVLEAARMDRRHFLMAAAAVAAAPGALATATMKFLGPSEEQVFRKLVEVMLPVEGTGLLSPTAVPVLETLDAALLGTMEPHVLDGVRHGIRFWNDGPKSSYGRTFVDLSTNEATRFCDRWAASPDAPQRALSMGLKKLVSLAYFANPPTWSPLGYGGPITKERRIPSLGNAKLPIGVSSPIK